VKNWFQNALNLLNPLALVAPLALEPMYHVRIWFQRLLWNGSTCGRYGAVLDVFAPVELYKQVVEFS
jgi:hypothetical protein